MIGNLHQEKIFEKQEQPASSRVEIYIVRHGKQEEYGDVHSDLSREGMEQAEKFAQDLIQNYLDQEVVIKIKKSTVGRASQTGEIIAAALTKEIQEKGIKNIKLLNTREAADLKTTGALGPIMASGVDYKKAVDEWLGNSDKYEDAKKPQEVLEQIGRMIESGDKLAKKVSPTGPKIVYVMVTHETAHAALMNKLTGRNTEELGGGIGHLEPMKIIMSHDSQVEPTLIFRDQEYQLSLDNFKKDENS